MSKLFKFSNKIIYFIYSMRRLICINSENSSFDTYFYFFIVIKLLRWKMRREKESEKKNRNSVAIDTCNHSFVWYVRKKTIDLHSDCTWKKKNSLWLVNKSNRWYQPEKMHTINLSTWPKRNRNDTSLQNLNSLRFSMSSID